MIQHVVVVFLMQRKSLALSVRSSFDSLTYSNVYIPILQPNRSRHETFGYSEVRAVPLVQPHIPYTMSRDEENAPADLHEMQHE
jgi:hypothetical protein